MGGSRTGPFCGTEEMASLCPVRDWWDQRSALAQRAEAELEMLRFSLVGKQGHWTRSEDIRGTAHVRGAEVREARLRWAGHVQRRDGGYSGRRMLRLAWGAVFSVMGLEVWLPVVS